MSLSALFCLSISTFLDSSFFSAFSAAKSLQKQILKLFYNLVNFLITLD